MEPRFSMRKVVFKDRFQFIYVPKFHFKYELTSSFEVLDMTNLKKIIYAEESQTIHKRQTMS